jgi:hypothetical protein
MCYAIPLVFLPACNDLEPVTLVDPIAPDFTASFVSIRMTDVEILRVAYSSYDHPPGFYFEDLGRGVRNYSLSYENTERLRTPGPDGWHAIEFSTDSRERAFQWSRIAVDSTRYGPVLGESQTERYFEFRYKDKYDSTFIVYSRVHKLSYLDRSMYDYRKPTPIVRRFNFRPLDENLVRSLVEYFWFFDWRRMGPSQALDIVTMSTPDTVFCVLYHLDINQAGDWGFHDQIYLQRSVYAVSRLTGDIVRSTCTLREVQGYEY